METDDSEWKIKILWQIGDFGVDGLVKLSNMSSHPYI